MARVVDDLTECRCCEKEGKEGKCDHGDEEKVGQGRPKEERTTVNDDGDEKGVLYLSLFAHSLVSETGSSFFIPQLTSPISAYIVGVYK